MNAQLLVIIAGIVSAIFAIGILLIMKKNKTLTDYYSLFITGATFIPLGLITENYIFSIIGLVVAAVGLAKKNEWKNHKLAGGKGEKIAIIIIVALLLIASLIVYLLALKNI